MKKYNTNSFIIKYKYREELKKKKNEKLYSHFLIP